ncbi:MAG: 2-amino-4-hydroxy-6-hydroxymethyldihydropteridine diphosphokinase [Jatrophihabitantaceae bacterium]
MTTAVLSIGSNLGDRLAAVQSAVDLFRPWLVALSPVYETPPWGQVPQGDFLNVVLVVADASASAADWLDRAHAAERAAGRTRDVRWGPRTLDVDVVDVDQRSSDDPALLLPHPRAGERAFVLVPWLAVQPHAQLSSRPLRDLLAALAPDEVTRVRARPDLVVV